MKGYLAPFKRQQQCHLSNLGFQVNLQQDIMNYLILHMHILKMLLKEDLGCERIDGGYYWTCQVTKFPHKARLWLQQ